MRWLAYGSGALVAAGIVALALFPLSLALALTDAPVEGAISGTVWNGEVADAIVGGREVGTVALEGHFLPLLSGRLVGDVAVDGPMGTGASRVSATSGRLSLSAVDAVLPLGAYGVTDPFGSPMAGVVALAGAVTLLPSGCESADMVATTDALSDVLRRMGREGFALTGPVTCEEGALVARLTGEGVDGGATAELRVAADDYRGELTWRPRDQATAEILRAYGFQRTPNGYRYTVRGVL